MIQCADIFTDGDALDEYYKCRT